MCYDVGGSTVFSGPHCASQPLSKEQGVPHAHSVGGTRFPGSSVTAGFSGGSEV